MSLFRTLTPKEVENFKAYAQSHEPDMKSWVVYHPVCRAEWIRLGKGPDCSCGHTGAEHIVKGTCSLCSCWEYDGRGPIPTEATNGGR